jgi:phosphoribosylanthranilate isomerase
MFAPFVKICGIQDEETARFTAKAGADFIGFVHYPDSVRHVSISRASLLSRVLGEKCNSVLLLVDPDNALLDEVQQGGGFDYIQLHGDETVSRTAEIKNKLKIPIIKAFRIFDADDFNNVESYVDYVDWFLFDAKAKSGEQGGGGESFDWSLLNGQCFSKPWMLSGGLNLQNIDEALSAVNPMGVDISSGIETIRGVKDLAKIKAFIGAVKAR